MVRRKKSNVMTAAPRGRRGKGRGQIRSGACRAEVAVLGATGKFVAHRGLRLFEAMAQALLRSAAA